jgi:hypothetical protein
LRMRKYSSRKSLLLSRQTRKRPRASGPEP